MAYEFTEYFRNRVGRKLGHVNERILQRSYAMDIAEGDEAGTYLVRVLRPDVAFKGWEHRAVAWRSAVNEKELERVCCRMGMKYRVPPQNVRTPGMEKDDTEAA